MKIFGYLDDLTNKLIEWQNELLHFNPMLFWCVNLGLLTFLLYYATKRLYRPTP